MNYRCRQDGGQLLFVLSFYGQPLFEEAPLALWAIIRRKHPELTRVWSSDLAHPFESSRKPVYYASRLYGPRNGPSRPIPWSTWTVFSAQEAVFMCRMVPYHWTARSLPDWLSDTLV